MILVTGGCGFIGSAVIASMKVALPGARVRVLDNFTYAQDTGLAMPFDQVIADRRRRYSDIGVELITADIRDAVAVAAASEGCDAIVHLAANTGVGPSVADPRYDMEVNVGGTLNVLEAARVNGVSRVVFASSGAPAGDAEPPIHEELPPRPLSPYGASKLAGEGYCSAYSRTFGVDTVSLRFGNVYGPGSALKSSAVAAFIRKALAGETCTVFGDGLQTRDFLYIDDLARAVELALERPVAGEIFQIASGVETSIRDMLQLLRGCLEARGISLHVDYAAPRLGDARRNYSDIGKARRVLGWEPTINLADGLCTTVDWFLQEGR